MSMNDNGLGLWRVAVLGAFVGVFAACAGGNGQPPGAADGGGTESGVDGGGLPPLGGGGADCQGACCPLPQLGATCAAADEGTTCSSSELCAGGLLLPQPIECDGGTWATQAHCNPDGGVASNGCPSSQPVDGDACGLPDGTSCQYALVCPSTCDAGTPSVDGGVGTGCASPSKVGPARCESGQWRTTSLGSCP